MRRPDFIYVGSPKAGSTWLFEAFRSNPDIYVLPSKSSGQYDGGRRVDRDAYCELYAAADSHQLCGEIAHDAFLHDDTAPRLAADFPDIRIMACLRNPLDYARSTLTWWKTHTDRFGDTCTEMTNHPHFRRGMDYASRLEPFYANFPAEQIGVFFFDELESNPERFLQRIHSFLGLSADCLPAMLNSRVNSARPPRNDMLTKAVYAGGGVARKIGLGSVVEKLKSSPVTQSLLYSENAPGPDLEIERASLAESLRAASMLSRLEAVGGIEVPRAWRI